MKTSFYKAASILTITMLLSILIPSFTAHAAIRSVSNRAELVNALNAGRTNANTCIELTSDIPRAVGSVLSDKK